MSQRLDCKENAGTVYHRCRFVQYAMLHYVAISESPIFVALCCTALNIIHDVSLALAILTLKFMTSPIEECQRRTAEGAYRLLPPMACTRVGEGDEGCRNMKHTRVILQVIKLLCVRMFQATLDNL